MDSTERLRDAEAELAQAKVKLAQYEVIYDNKEACTCDCCAYVMTYALYFMGAVLLVNLYHHTLPCIACDCSVMGDYCTNFGRIIARYVSAVFADTLCFLCILTCVCVRSKAWLAARVPLRLARMPRPARARRPRHLHATCTAAPVLFAHAFGKHTMLAACTIDSMHAIIVCLSRDVIRVVELFHTPGQRCMHQEQPRQDDRKQINNVAAQINMSLCYFRFFKLALGASAPDASRFLLILPTNALLAATDTRILALPDLLGFPGLALASVITYTDRK